MLMRASPSVDMGVRGLTMENIRTPFEKAGLEFIPENGGGVGVRFSKPNDSDCQNA
jgi:hypothetical protein